MTDTNIIHALQCCGVETNCRNCPLYEERSADCIYTVLKNALELITRQQAEIDSLKIFRGYAKKRASDYRTMRDKYLNAKSEAVKEFAERLKEKSFKTIRNYGLTKDVVEVCDIDNLLKEMVGEDNA